MDVLSGANMLVYVVGVLIKGFGIAGDACSTKKEMMCQGGEGMPPPADTAEGR